MLIITTELFENNAIDYANYKNQESGILTEVILTEPIYNEFNNGNESPEAIRNFLKFAYENWSEENKLKYVLFVGDAKRDYHAGNNNDNVVPAFQYISY